MTRDTGGLPDKVGVIGGGRMGAGIAQTFLTRGTGVVIVDSDPQRADAARTRVSDGLTKAHSKDGSVVAPAAALSRLRTCVDPGDLAGCGLIVEAVPEEPVLKAKVLQAAAAAAPDAVLASNTSSLSIDGLADGLPRPEHFIGLHFFNPVPVSGLVEIVVGSRTAPTLVSAAQDWARALGKAPITVTDSPGFASSRLGVCLALEAMRMLEEGVASAADIDTAMTLGYRHPMGPLRTTDLVGLDVRLAIAEHLAGELGPRFQPPRILRDLVAKGNLGRKTGQGFYTW
ncbi:3-hydroxybutyryl-CoA dehydrogenase [Actinomadura sp. CNU-125]|uniref:3-hydroxyacyl-CoA dehydrogenase family protein n=1 Tax=Actinomadura sp. CNU-125 TaxID=1904961 RepID=UPI00095F980E|nr:3-hydroxyacyl-CoA dehydrogenase family protein [Actinomadura sp. CNU-125]OLT19086.1 3-hydroxybutyryl-CoA dehydrogenase [Actinomadura sp. CNU-125]